MARRGSAATDWTDFANAIREVLGLAPLRGDPVLTDEERFYREPLPDLEHSSSYDSSGRRRVPRSNW